MILNYPTNSRNISLEFGYDATYDSELSGFYKLFDNKHPGVDFDLAEGTNVNSSFEGFVVRNEFHQGMGNTLGIRNGNILALYAHLSEINVSMGAIVKKEELIAKSGNTGSASTSPHLHFELRDLRFKILREMVFKPEFLVEIRNFQEEFTYKINNTNTPKNLNLISKMYFGSENFAENIKIKNNLNIKNDAILPQDFDLLIPNFTVKTS